MFAMEFPYLIFSGLSLNLTPLRGHRRSIPLLLQKRRGKANDLVEGEDFAWLTLISEVRKWLCVISEIDNK